MIFGMSGRILLLSVLAFTASQPGLAQLAPVAVGHEFRQDDMPAIATAADGSVWVAWVSYVGDRDDLAIRHYRDGRWGNIQWVPNTSGDSWHPQLFVDAAGRPCVVWSQQLDSNVDLYARCFDPSNQEWGAATRLSSDPLPDISPRLWTDGKGKAVLVWQGFRGRNSNIFLKTFDGANWSAEVRVTNRAANDWDPAVAMDSRGNAWVVYDSYKNGDYDVFLTEVRGGRAPQPERTVSATPRFEARATVAVDTGDRVWVAWEAGQPNWGKDQGYIVRNRRTGVPLGGVREPRIRCLENGRWREPESPLASAFRGNTHQPEVFSDGRGSVWVAAKPRVVAQLPKAAGAAGRGYWEYWLTHYDGGKWSPAIALPNSKGRSTTRSSAALAASGELWLAWPTDNRREGMYHRPIRQQVYAGRIAAPAPAGALALRAVAEEKVDATPGHFDEAGDLRALRAHVVVLGGKKHQIVRGDFHRHTELSWDGGGGGDGNLQDNYRYQIDVAGMEFSASTDHQGGAWPYWWWYSQKMTDMYHVPGVHVPIFGYERSSTYPWGHHNMFFAKRSEAKVTPFFMKQGVEAFSLPLGPQGDESGIGSGALVENDTRMLYEELRGREVVAISHTSGTRMGTDWRDNDPFLEPVVEIFQGCRTSYEQLGAPYVAREPEDAAHMKQAGYEPLGMVNNAWAKGYKLGIIAASDHGSTHISYALVYTDEVSRRGILNAIRKRHTYGATDNILLDVRMGQHFMGDEFKLARPQPLRVMARGARPVARIDIIKDSKVIYSTDPKQQKVEFEYTDTTGVTGRHYIYVRLMQEDGMIAWSSPMFINY